MNEFEQKLAGYQERVERALDRALTFEPCPQQAVIDAMRYSLLGGGKRIRAVLLLEFAGACGISEETAMPFAAALEMIHAYSLIHDDLPCMDDDDLRRGKPSCHIRFGEANALLAGDALLTHAFGLAASAPELPPYRVMSAVEELARAAGAFGMIGGQVLDLESEGREIDEMRLLSIHRLKTGALISAGPVMGCILGGALSRVPAAREYGAALGLAFQIVDDILDVTGIEQLLGKPIGSDRDNIKTTTVSLYGLERARRLADELTDQADALLDHFGFSDGFMSWLTCSLAHRQK
ncbi:MAG: polyprenyl synthetase family protein [Oscillospiraceae bacterium]|nr:polyprenyl synthetase family protein [Oscillospiraceae bacterium]